MARGKTKVRGGIKCLSLGREWIWAGKPNRIPTFTQTTGKKSMSAIRSHLILRIYIGPLMFQADIVQISVITGFVQNSSASGVGYVKSKVLHYRFNRPFSEAREPLRQTANSDPLELRSHGPTTLTVSALHRPWRPRLRLFDASRLFIAPWKESRNMARYLCGTQLPFQNSSEPPSQLFKQSFRDKMRLVNK